MHLVNLVPVCTISSTQNGAESRWSVWPLAWAGRSDAHSQKTAGHRGTVVQPSAKRSNLQPSSCHDYTIQPKSPKSCPEKTLHLQTLRILCAVSAFDTVSTCFYQYCWFCKLSNHVDGEKASGCNFWLQSLQVFGSRLQLANHQHWRKSFASLQALRRPALLL